MGVIGTGAGGSTPVLKRVKLGPSPCDIKTLLPDFYDELTIDNFILEFASAFAQVGNNGYDAVSGGGRYDSASFKPTKKYDAQTGTFTYTQSYRGSMDEAFSVGENGHRNGYANMSASVTAFLIYAE